MKDEIFDSYSKSKVRYLIHALTTITHTHKNTVQNERRDIYLIHILTAITRATILLELKGEIFNSYSKYNITRNYTVKLE